TVSIFLSNLEAIFLIPLLIFVVILLFSFNRAFITELLKEARWKKRVKPSSPYKSESKSIPSSQPFATLG
ncbi:MAG: hypothetical protein COS09_01320, partial [Candidatus Nealsonbacteria bacterium CG01_land_8_20_14_3_00_12]